MSGHPHIDAFALAAHRVLALRVAHDADMRREALEVIQRWRAQAEEPSHSECYWQEWEHLLAQADAGLFEASICALSDHAATLRSVSPLGRFLTPAERFQLLRQSRQAA